MSLSIDTKDLSKQGTLYLLFDYFLIYYEDGKHLKKLIKVTLNAANLKKPSVATTI